MAQVNAPVQTWYGPKAQRVLMLAGDDGRSDVVTVLFSSTGTKGTYRPVPAQVLIEWGLTDEGGRATYQTIVGAEALVNEALASKGYTNASELDEAMVEELL